MHDVRHPDVEYDYRKTSLEDLVVPLTDMSLSTGETFKTTGITLAGMMHTHILLALSLRYRLGGVMARDSA